MTPTDAWNRIVARCRNHMRESTLGLWIEPGKPLRIEDDLLLVAYDSPHPFVWVSAKYLRYLGDAAREEGLAGVKLVPEGEGR